MVNWDDNNDNNEIQEILNDVADKRSFIGKEVETDAEAYLGAPAGTVEELNLVLGAHGDSVHREQAEGRERQHRRS